MANGDDTDDQQPNDETMELPLDGTDDDVIDTNDGGALVKVDDAAGRRATNSKFFRNLVDELTTDGKLQAVILDLSDKIEEDKQAREDRDKQQAEGIARSGFSPDPPGGASFTGASKVVHPMIGKASIQYASKCMKELFPPDGPVKEKVVGQVTALKLERAARKKEHMNWQLTEQMPEFAPTLEQVLTQVPNGGSQYIKLYWDREEKRPAAEAMWVDDVLLPYSAKSFLSARRRTFTLRLTQEQVERRIASGLYVDVPEQVSATEPEQTKSEEKSAKIEGKDQSGLNPDNVGLYHECYVWLDLEDWDDERPEGYAYAPYLVTIEADTNRCLGFYRNWDPLVAEQRGVLQEVEHNVEFMFLPWRGAYGLSLYGAIGQLSVAATGSLRALLDSAHLNNSQTALKIKNATGGQNIRIEQTGIVEVQGAVGQDDVRKAVMPLPFNPPSAVLYQLLGFLSEQADDMVRTTIEDAPDSNPNMPVGTALQRTEQGMVVFSSMHARNHKSVARLLKILHRLNRDHLDGDVLKEETGELLATPQDYEGPLDVVPVSDPNIFSEMQRYGQIQVIAQRAQGNPLYNQAKVEELILKQIKIPDPDSLLVTPPNPDPQDPITENVSIALGKPVVAFPDQDHVSHLQCHLPFFLDPNLFLNMLVGAGAAGAALQHLKEHLVLLYAKACGDLVQRKLNAPLHQVADDVDPGTQKSLASAFAVASRIVLGGDTENTFKQIGEAAQKLLAFAQTTAQQQQPQDPAMVSARAQTAAVQLEGQKAQADAQDDQQKNQLKAQELRQKGQLGQADLQQRGQQVQGDLHLRAQEAQTDAATEADRAKQAVQDAAVAAGQQQQQQRLDQQKLGQDAELEQLRERVKLVINEQDNASALKIALMELAEGREARVSDGHGLNPNP